MDIGDLHDFIDLIENKDQDNYHSPAEKDEAIFRASMDLFWDFAPLYGKDEEAKAALDPFQNNYQVTPANSPAGVVTLPTGIAFPSPLNYARLLSARAISYDNKRMQVIYRDIEMINDDAIPQRLSSQLKPVTIDWPVASSKGNGVFQLYPQIPNTAIFSYLSLPVKPRYAYNQTGRVITYDAGVSTQLQWNESYFTKIIEKAIVYLGLNLGDANLVQFMNQKTAS